MRFTLFDPYLLPVCIDIVLSYLQIDDRAKQAGKYGDWEYCSSLYRQQDLNSAAKQAAKAGLSELVDHLVNLGADKDGVILGACEGGQVNLCCKWLPPTTLSEKELYYAAGRSGDGGMIMFIDPRVLFTPIACPEDLRVAMISGLCRSGNVTMVKWIFKDFVEHSISNKAQYLTSACRNGCLELVQFLLPRVPPMIPPYADAFKAACRSGSSIVAKFVYKHHKIVTLADVIAAGQSRNLYAVKFVRPFIKPNISQTFDLFAEVRCKQNNIAVIKYLKHMTKLDANLTQEQWQPLWFWSARSAASCGDQQLTNYCEKHNPNMLLCTAFNSGKEHYIVAWMRKHFRKNDYFIEGKDAYPEFFLFALAEFCRSKNNTTPHPFHRWLLFASQTCCWKNDIHIQNIQHQTQSGLKDCDYCNQVHQQMHKERNALLRLRKKRKCEND